MGTIKYHIARLKDGRLVDVNELTEATRHQEFYCIGCGELLVPKMGNNNRWHFAHKSGVNCNPETYLHKLAKIKIKAIFDNSETFSVKYKQNVSCDTKECKYRGYRCCVCREITLNLKSKYDSCALEKDQYADGQRFRADVLLFKEGAPEIAPTFIEIHVKHECSEIKQRSGFSIIEITVSDEQSIDKIVQNSIMDENNQDVALYGFEKEVTDSLDEGILRYVHVKGEKPIIRKISCRDCNIMLREDSDLEINCLDQDDYYNENNVILADTISRLFYVRDCCTCSYYRQENIFSHNYSCYNPFCANNDRTCFERLIDKDSHIDGSLIHTLEVIKNELPQREKFKVAICATMEFLNFDYAEVKVRHFLENKLISSDIFIIAGMISSNGGGNGAYVARNIASKLGVPFIMYYADWDKYKKSAPAIVNTQVLQEADALIYFWNGNDSDPQYVVKKAKDKNIPCRIVNYGKENDLCPICGGKMVQRYGKYGSFLGCIGYPECNGLRKTPLY